MIALFAAVIYRLIKNKIVSTIVAACSFTLMLVCVVYSLLLGAEFTEVLIYVLVFTLLYALTFVSHNTTSDKNNEQAEGESIVHIKDGPDNSDEVYNPPEENDEAKGEML